MKVLIACEFSGRVRDAFTALGHDAWSCDLLETESPGQHIKDNVLDYINEDWDLMIAHPPCTHLCSSGARWFKGKQVEQEAAIDFVWELWNAPIDKIVIENPIGVLSKALYEPDQIIQPHWFGDGETKATCLWLKNLPTLKATHRMGYHEIKSSIHHEPPGPNRWKNRSRTFPGIALAMAQQWGTIQSPYPAIPPEGLPHPQPVVLRR